MLTRVVADTGHEGHSMARAHGGQSGRGIADAIVSSIKPRVIGQDAFGRERIWQRMMALEPAGYVSAFAISAVDVALWDLVAKSLDLPLFRLLGGRADAIMAYASSANMECTEDYVRDLHRAIARGYRAYKIHPFDDPARDIELCRVIRKEAGDGFRLMLDLPVIGAETVPGSVFAAANTLRAGALDMLLCDVYWKAGVTGMLKTANLCEAMGVGVASHHGASPLMNFANLHVLCGATSADMIEVLVPEEGYDFALRAYLAPGRDGMVRAPSAAGLGVEIDFDYITAHTTARL